MSLPGKWKLEDLLRVSLIKNINPKTLKEIIENYDSPEHLHNSKLPSHLSLIFNQNELFNEDKDRINYQLDLQFKQLRNTEYSIITYWDEIYPQLLKKIDFAPPLLYVRGQLCDTDSLSIAVVGTRRCTSYGRRTAERFAEFFAKNNIIVTSGLANGIDTFSHNAAMKAGGITYAVVASGLDKISPGKKMEDAGKIVESGGAIITEYPFGTNAALGFFLRRNRIISGISRAVLVVESAFRGGSLNTANYAFNQSRELYSVPGNINSEMSEGTNLLIKKNMAIPALSPESMLKELLNRSDGMINGNEVKEEPVVEFDSEEEKNIYGILSNDPVHVDAISQLTGYDMPVVLVKLLNLEFSGAIKQLPGKHFIKN